jgi:hypothetical protein
LFILVSIVQTSYHFDVLRDEHEVDAAEAELGDA